MAIASMKPTERLYYLDSQLLEFAATALEVRQAGELTHVVLDRTAFHPTGGGQPNDTGYIEADRVVDVIEGESGQIIHVIRGPATISAGQIVRGRIDAIRRLDHMQQHTGQHILSRAFVLECGAETRSFHLGAEYSTIDIELDEPNEEKLGAAEELANKIVFEDRPIRAHIFKEGAELRRIIEIEGFDMTPCGGTHAARTGQVGLIAIRSHERAKRMIRIEFLCGRRALLDYRAANRIAAKAAGLFSASRDALPELVASTIGENKSLKKKLRNLLEIALDSQAERMLKSADLRGSFKVIRAVFEDKDAEEVRILANKIIEREPAIALLGSRGGGAARLVFARSRSLWQDMGQLMQQACQVLGGRGGGRPEIAQGGGPQVDKLEEAINLAAEKIK
jgi:alanyl-tRNA synthetase